ncbi:hypothetical protein EI94DRAFT_1333036 [Lactarius quietus]|nr:hypothetical protein EI94DRAFT_1333036 [Lactarius quietus]
MSQSPSTSKSTSTSSPHFRTIFVTAIKEYERKTKTDLHTHPLATQLQSCNSSSDILKVLHDKVNEFDKSRSHNERLSHWLNPTINVLYAFSATLCQGVGLIFSPANVISAGIGILFQAAKDVGASEEALADLFERIENFFRRLESYTEVPPTNAMTDVIVNLAHTMDKKLDIVMNDEKDTKLVLDDVKWNQLRENLRKWVTPPDPSTNHNIACGIHHGGTAQWFFEGSIFAEWKSIGTLLWIYGKPGSGKSILCSTIIQDIAKLRKAGSALMSYFYFDFRDLDKQTVVTSFPLSSFSFLLSPVPVATSSQNYILRTTMVHKSPAIV